MTSREAVERVEYIVVGDKDGRTWTLSDATTHKGTAEHFASEPELMYPAYSNVRVQSSTVTRTPWSDLKEGQESDA